MAKTALNQLQEQVEAVRREAFAAGYAAAMQAIRELAAKPAPSAEAAPTRPRGRPRSPEPVAPTAPPRPRQPRAAATPPPQRTRASIAKRPQRGSNARLVQEVLQANAPRALRPAEIRSTIQRDKGVAMAFTSIRHALGQLEARHVVEQVADSKTWRHREGAAPEAD